MKLSDEDLGSLGVVAEQFDAKVTSYSGRGMLGKTCLAVVGHFSAFDLGAVVGSRGTSGLTDALLRHGYFTDDLGHGTVNLLAWDRGAGQGTLTNNFCIGEVNLN